MKNEHKRIGFAIILLIFVYIFLIHPNETGRKLNIGISLFSGLILILFLMLENVDFSKPKKYMQRILQR